MGGGKTRLSRVLADTHQMGLIRNDGYHSRTSNDGYHSRTSEDDVRSLNPSYELQLRPKWRLVSTSGPVVTSVQSIDGEGRWPTQLHEIPSGSMPSGGAGPTAGPTCATCSAVRARGWPKWPIWVCRFRLVSPSRR